MAAKIPPRPLIRVAWSVHRAMLAVSGARIGLALPVAGAKSGMLQLHTVGRRSGKPRAVVLNYLEDGDDLVVLASNAGDPAHPAWWLNLEARPEVSVDLVGGRRSVHARAAGGDERERLLGLFRGLPMYQDLDAVFAQRGRETPVVVLEPRRA
ncbi:nitroreductase/quinone reductase family protein [Actinoplanes rectilineatus]|uniref:nitroreductase/quinone reductase family protein n=1 Tax=Actinoplanes rectilineatus TaxID=113571 RepID=UPI0005F29DCA|nr:nitroreductase/quinone reductase family protein [Actinoplanes rectilineatus]